MTINPDIFTNKFNSKWNNRYELISTYNRCDEKIKIKCNKCSSIHDIRADHALNNKQLCKCHRHKLSLSDFIKKAKLKHNNTYTYDRSVYNGYRVPLTVTCKLHGNFLITPDSHLSGTGCIKCKLSKGEQSINNILTKHSISYIPQYRFNDCKYKKPLPFDFYIPIINTCIEYNGEQHYKPVRFNGIPTNQAEENYTKQKIKDNIKTKYCNLNNIPLVTIKYTQYNDITVIIESLLKNHGLI